MAALTPIHTPVTRPFPTDTQTTARDGGGDVVHPNDEEVLLLLLLAAHHGGGPLRDALWDRQHRHVRASWLGPLPHWRTAHT